MARVEKETLIISAKHARYWLAVRKLRRICAIQLMASSKKRHSFARSLSRRIKSALFAVLTLRQAGNTTGRERRACVLASPAAALQIELVRHG
jgi:hypothetical protein